MTKYLRGVALAKWFQFIGGATAGVGAVVARYVQYELFGIGLFVSGIVVQFLALAVPEIQRWNEERRSPKIAEPAKTNSN